ncbi:HAD family hydrolase [Metallosphaera javensis (ex Sakai et al. 2022)]|uniref:HAD family hydrolase n=1 Tax=Metallosphaera javensis (ex Sakai et al. 2022) TaxID=2775498 RepID=UPI00258C1414|nr:MAG: hypothetical protein MjAS7_2667 [Metallosphaera javensis (ex Sakai et al. 2022)]
MDFGIWLDGVVLDVDTTESLYSSYKGSNSPVPITSRVNPDWPSFYARVKNRGRVYLLSPYSCEDTREILRKVGIEERFVCNTGKTKPSKEPTERLVMENGLDPLNLVIIGSSPLDLLSARFYDSRIRVVCVVRKSDCSKYSPFIQVKNLDEALKSLERLKLLP